MTYYRILSPSSLYTAAVFLRHILEIKSVRNVNKCYWISMPVYIDIRYAYSTCAIRYDNRDNRIRFNMIVCGKKVSKYLFLYMQYCTFFVSYYYYYYYLIEIVRLVCECNVKCKYAEVGR